MTKKQWKERIVKACKDAKTYKPFFESEYIIVPPITSFN